MKIINPKETSHRSLTSSKKTPKTPITGSSFSKFIEENQDEPILESLFQDSDTILSNMSVLAEELDKLGQELAEKPLPETFHKYKKHIRILLKGANKNMEIRETTGRSGLTRTKLFRTSQAIDEALAQLAQRILNDEKNRIEILKLTNHLQGLILDIIT